MTATPAVEFPDGVGVVRGELLPIVDPTPIFGRIPNPRPNEFYRMTRVGGTRRDLVTDRPLILVEAYALTDSRAQDLAQAARTGILAMRGTVADDGTAIYRVNEASGLVNDPDPVSDQARHRFTVEVHLRGTEAAESA